MTVNEHTYPPGSPSGSNQGRGWSCILPFGCLVAVVVKIVQQSHQESLEHSEITGPEEAYQSARVGFGMRFFVCGLFN
jgi:hypothetical protein